MTRLRDRPGDLAALVSAASTRFRLPLADVEKDYWVVELLRSVSRPVSGGELVFKGGTSLSKAYQIIERFSEDVDVLVVPSDDASAGKRDRLLKEVAARAASDLELEGRLETSTKGVKRNVAYDYPASYPDPGRLRAGVLLEMGIRGGPEPHETREVRSYVASSAMASGVPATEFEDFAPVYVLTLRPERTLVEKLGLIHDRATRIGESPSGFAGQGRHIYDVYRLLKTDDVRKAISSPGLVPALAADADENSRRHGFQSTPRPITGFADSPAWTGAGEVRRIMEESLTVTANLVWGRMPTFDDVVATVAEMREHL